MFSCRGGACLKPKADESSGVAVIWVQGRRRPMWPRLGSVRPVDALSGARCANGVGSDDRLSLLGPSVVWRHGRSLLGEGNEGKGHWTPDMTYVCVD